MKKMKVKIKDKIYDSNDEPIMIMLEEDDKSNIKNMGDAKKYCSYPSEGYEPENISSWMKEIS